MPLSRFSAKPLKMRKRKIPKFCDGIVVTAATFLLGMFRAELLGIVFSLTTLAGQTVIAFLEQFGAAPIGSGSTDPSS